MGNLLFTAPPTYEPQGSSTLKLEAQKIKDFSGAHEDWQKWKSRTECAFQGSGYELILGSSSYTDNHPRMNAIVYSQLSAATVDGVAYHLIQRYEHTKNGNAAWANLCQWYDGSDILNETAENLRVKLDNLKLHLGITGGDYVNKFMAWHRDLDKIVNEGMTDGHAVYLFLKNITDVEYATTVTFCRNTNANLDKCVAAVRKQERDIQQKSLEKRRLKSIIRRLKEEASEDEDTKPAAKKKRKVRRTETSTKPANNPKFDGELQTTESGLLRFEVECWKKMQDKEKEFVREYNAAVKHKEPLEKVTMPKGITVRARRTNTVESLVKNEEDTEPMKKGGKRRKGITFGVTDEDHNEE
jgi:hypothetical protein